MSGRQVFNWREGDRNEYVASFLLSALGLVTPFPRHEDIGVDFYCALADQEKSVTSFGFPFLVLVKSTAKPVVHLKAPKKYRHQKGVLPDHLSWLFLQEVPLFLALVDKDENSIGLYSLSPLWFLVHDHETCPDCASLRLVPRTKSEGTAPVEAPRSIGNVTSSPKSHEYEVDLGPPVASFSMEDTANRQTMLRQKNFLRSCIEHEFENLVFARAGLPHFHWITESDSEQDGPKAAFHCREVPGQSERLRHVYSLLGPALIPLALRYKSDDRKDLLAGLRTLFREIPADTIPPEIRKMLPEIFRD